MENSWIMTGVGLVKKIRNATQSICLRLGELVAEPHIKCPSCECKIDTSNVHLVWPALPAGVKFDPTDSELLRHLQGKSSLLNSKSHGLIDTFIPTIEEKGGICYTHPKNLPGIKMDGSSSHFFHRVSNAYSCGQRKRRKVSGDVGSVCDEHIRWHKTGKAKPLYDDSGVKKGWKEILVLYRGSKKGGSNTDIDNWVMHQYHLDAYEPEADGELVVSKVFYQLASKKNDKSEMNDIVVEPETSAAKIDPRTPKTEPPQPRLLNNSPCDTEQYTPFQEEEEECGTEMNDIVVEPETSAAKIDPRTPKTEPPQPRLLNNSPCDTEQYTPFQEEECGTSFCPVKVESAECSAWLDELLSPAVITADLPASDEPRQARDTMDAGPEPIAPIPVDGSNTDLFDGLPDLDTTLPCLGTPSDGPSLSDIHFGSQDSFAGWLELDSCAL